jgi:hypothetical protein
MLILELKPGELLRMRTPSGEIIDVMIEDSSEHLVRFSISAPPTIHIDTEGKSGTTSKPRVTKGRKKSWSQVLPPPPVHKQIGVDWASMIYLKSIVGGILAGVILLIAYGALVASRYRGRGMVAIPLFAPFTVAVILLGFAAGFYLVFRISRWITANFLWRRLARLDE